MHSQSYIAIHAGQSVSHARMRTELGDTVEQTLPGVITSQPLVPQWAAFVARLVEAAGPADAPGTVALGSSGLTRETAHDLLRTLAPLGIHEVALAHDSVTSYLGALGTRTGAVIFAGTGTICRAVGATETARVDGWGYLLGDAGSAYWIGRTALEAALRGHDGRRQMAALTDRMRSEFGDIEWAYADLQSDPNRVTRIASFATHVEELAATDRVAANILDKAAAHLAEAVQAGLRRVGLNGPQAPRVAAIGRVFDNGRVLTRFTDFMALQWPEFALTEPAATTLDGTEALLTLPVEHPLYSGVSFATRG